jgi:hypothetical protein
MLLPPLDTRIEKLGGLPAEWVYRLREQPFESVTAPTGQPKVFFVVCSSGGQRNQVFKFHRHSQQGLTAQTIPAAKPRLLSNFFEEPFGNSGTCLFHAGSSVCA